MDALLLKPLPVRDPASLVFLRPGGFQYPAFKAFQTRNSERGPDALKALQRAATTGGNVFAELINTVRWCSLGQISRALYDVGGQYRRSI